MKKASVPKKWLVEQLAMRSAPNIHQLVKELIDKIKKGDWEMRRLKKDIIARIIT
jgi:hypothetical protein